MSAQKESTLAAPRKSQPGETAEPEIDYTPKTMSSAQQLAFAAKLGAIVGALVLVLWLLNRMV